MGFRKLSKRPGAGNQLSLLLAGPAKSHPALGTE
jgi:hypothetical protein